MSELKPVAWMYKCDYYNHPNLELTPDVRGYDPSWQRLPLYSADTIAELQRERDELREKVSILEARCEFSFYQRHCLQEELTALKQQQTVETVGRMMK